MELNLQKLEDGSSQGSVAVSEQAFGQDFNETLIHQVVTAYLAKARSGTSAQKTRSEVSGGGAKPFRQKGTGRARAGTIRSPLWRSGGVTFAAKTRDYSQKVNKKMFRGAMRSILSELVRQDRLIVVDKIQLDTHKTRDLVSKLKIMGLDSSVLFVSDSVDEKLYLASRNLVDVNVCDVAAADPVSLVGHDKIVMSADAVKRFEEWLA